MKVETENIMYAHCGNGVVVFDGNRMKNGDYMTVAHIDYNRDIMYYTHILSDSAKCKIENFAKSGNMRISLI
jgi:hypothetical protein